MSQPTAMPSPHAETAPAPGALPPRRGQRLALRIIGIIALVVAGLGAFLYFAPQHAARWIADYYLKGLNIDVTGVETVGIDVFRGQLWFGPVSFRSGDVPPGRVDRLGLNLSVGELFKRRGVVDALVITGIDLRIEQTPQGGFLLNGVPLGAGETPEAASEPEPPPQVEHQPAQQLSEAAETPREGIWGTGIERLELVDSKALFISAAGGEIGLNIAQLWLDGFRSWEPEQPGTFRLRGDVNGIAVEAEGEAKPFVEPINALVRWSVKGIEIERVERFTGPLGLSSKAGRLDLAGNTEVLIDTGAGTLEAIGKGTGDFAGIDVAKPDLGAFGLGKLTVAYNGQYRFDENANSRFAGTINGDAVDFRMHLATGVKAAFARAQLAPKPLAVAVDAGGAAQLDGEASLTLDGLTLDTGAPVSVGSLGVDLAPLRLTAAGPDLGVQTVGRVQLRQVAAAAPPAQMGLAAAAIELPKLDVAITGGKTTLTSELTLKAQQPQVAVAGAAAGQGTRASADVFALDVPKLLVEVSGDGVTANVTATTGLAATRLSQTAGPAASSDVKIDAITINATDVTAKAAGPSLAVAGALTGRINALGFSQREAAARGRPAGEAMRAAVRELTVGLPQLRIDGQGDRLTVRGPLTTELTGVDGALPALQPQQPSATLNRLTLRSGDLAVNVTPAQTQARGRLSLQTDDFRGTWRAPETPTDPAGPASGRVGKVELDLNPADVRLGAKGLVASTAATLVVSDVMVASPEVTPWTRGQVSLGSLRTAVREGAVDLTSAAPQWRARLDLALQQIATGGEQRPWSQLKIDGVSIADAQLDQKPNLEIDRITVRRIESAFGSEWLKAVTTPRAETEVRETAREVREAQQAGDLPILKLGSLHLADGANFRFRDTTIQPNPTFDLALETLDIQNVNRAQPDLRTNLLVRGTLNEFTPIQASGWASPFADPMSFDLTASVQSLELPPLSPYSAQAVGVNLESGRLSVDTGAQSDRGKLQGKVMIDVQNLNLASASAADNPITGIIGMPVESAVGLLKDPSGRIQLNIPISGDVNSPSFDIGGVIRQALAGAVQAAAMAPFKLALLPVDILASAVGGGAPKFEPVVFAAGDTALQPQADKMIESLAILLRERSQLVVQVCGQATAADEQVLLAERPLPAAEPERSAAQQRLEARLGTIASARTFVVRNALRERGVGDRQVLQCRSAFSSADSGPPRADVKF
jgi:hypothetical protein